jgi:phage shock protein E
VEPSGLWIFLGTFALYIGYRSFRFARAKRQIPALLDQGAVIVDVRTPAEFQSAANPKSINIPLDRFLAESKVLPKDKPVILCCASGARSGAAVGVLKAQGFQKVLNAGPWTNTL